MSETKPKSKRKSINWANQIALSEVITVILKLPVVNIITNSMAELKTNEYLIIELFREPKKAYELLLALHPSR
jgi:hypothetical protein